MPVNRPEGEPIYKRRQVEPSGTDNLKFSKNVSLRSKKMAALTKPMPSGCSAAETYHRGCRAASDRRGPQPRSMAGPSRSLMPGGRFRRRPSSVAATASGRVGDANRRQGAGRGRAFIRR